MGFFAVQSDEPLSVDKNILYSSYWEWNSLGGLTLCTGIKYNVVILGLIMKWHCVFYPFLSFKTPNVSYASIWTVCYSDHAMNICTAPDML